MVLLLIDMSIVDFVLVKKSFRSVGIIWLGWMIF